MSVTKTITKPQAQASRAYDYLYGKITVYDEKIG